MARNDAVECFPELTYAMYLDGELAAEESARVRAHISACARCRELVAAFTAENSVLTATMAEAGAEEHALAGRARWLEIAGVASVLALIGGVISWLNQQDLPAAVSWLNVFSSDGRSNFAFNLFFYLSSGGAQVFEHMAVVVGWVVMMVLAGAGLIGLARRQRRSLSGLSLVSLVLLFSLPGMAVETRGGQRTITIAQGETVNDTLFAHGETVEIDGVINGDLFVAARSVTVRGTVKGNIFSWSKDLDMNGSAGSSIFGFAQHVQVRGNVGHSIYAFAQFLRLEPVSQVGTDILVFSQEANLAGKIEGGVMAFVGMLNVRADIGRNIVAQVGEMNLDVPAHVAGGLTARVHHDSDVRIADGVTIGGPRNIKLIVHRSRFSRPWFYIWGIISLAGSFVVGWVALYLFPGFFQRATAMVGTGWRPFSLGFALLFAIPFGCLLVALTLIGLPLALMSVGLFIIGLRLGLILVGAYVGSLLFKPTQLRSAEGVMGLFFGLLILTVVFLVPFLGFLIKFLAYALGMGALARQLYEMRRTAAG